MYLGSGGQFRLLFTGVSVVVVFIAGMWLGYSVLEQLIGGIRALSIPNTGMRVSVGIRGFSTLIVGLVMCLLSGLFRYAFIAERVVLAVTIVGSY